jgi:hypothetical protein
MERAMGKGAQGSKLFLLDRTEKIGMSMNSSRISHSLSESGSGGGVEKTGGVMR